ncbi:MAG: hypothetical protein AMXMBFR78_01990 [Rubrivivax sp.]
MTPNIIHTMKHTVKASVLTISTDRAWLCLLLMSPPASLPVDARKRPRPAASADAAPALRQKNDGATPGHRSKELGAKRFGRGLRQVKSKNEQREVAIEVTRHCFAGLMRPRRRRGQPKQVFSRQAIEAALVIWAFGPRSIRGACKDVKGLGLGRMTSAHR